MQRNELFLDGKPFQACAATLICRWGVRPSNSEEILVSWRWRKTHGVKSQERWRHRTSNNLYSITIRTRRFYVEKFHQNHPKSMLRIKKTPRFGQLGFFFPLNKNMCCWGRLVTLSFWGPVKFQGFFCWTMLNFRGVNCKIPLSEGSSLK